MSRPDQVEEARYGDTRVESCLKEENRGPTSYREAVVTERAEEAEYLRKEGK